MGLLAEAFNPRPRGSATSFDGGGGPIDTLWYRDVSGFIAEQGSAGIGISADTMLNCGTVLAAVRFRGNTWARCQPSTFQKTATGRKEVPDHYSQRVLRRPRPGARLTGFQWRQLNGVWLATWGNAYSEIVAGRRSWADELRPMHPSHMKVVDQRSDGSLVYRYTPPGEEARQIGQEKVLHFRDLTTNGITGLEWYKLIRNVVGIALLTERHATSSLRKGSRLAGLLTPVNPLKPDQRKDLHDSVNEEFGGAAHTGTVGVLPHGVTFTPMSSSNKESQFMELSDNVVGAILRFMGVPGFVIGYQGDKANTYASAKETSQEAMRSVVQPLIENVEEQEEATLLPEDTDLQIKHNMDEVLRVNTADRYEAHFKACGGPWMSRNEVRRIEDLNEDDNPAMDEVLTPSNMTGRPGDSATVTGAEGDGAPDAPEQEAARVLSEEPEESAAPSGEQAPEDDGAPPPKGKAKASAHARALEYATASAERVVRCEINAIRGRDQGSGLAGKYAKDPKAWEAAVGAFYGKHADFVADAMRIGEAQAAAYCAGQAAALKSHGVGIIETWEATVVPRLAAIGVGPEGEEAA